MNSSTPGRSAAPGSGLFVGLLSTEAAGQRSAILGYLFAAAAACISGVSVFVNSLGVRTFADPVVYTALKDGLVGLVLLVPLPEGSTGLLISGETMPAGSVYTIGSDPTERRLAMFMIQTQVNPGTGRLIPIGNLSSVMREALKAADGYLKAHTDELGINRDPRQYDFTVQAVNLNQAKEGAETAIAFFISMVSALLDRPTDGATVVAGEMTVKGLLHRVTNLPERLELARDAGANRILVPSQNKRDIVDIPDEILDQVQPVFYTHPINAAMRAMRLE